VELKLDFLGGGPRKEAANDDELHKLLKARHNAALKAADAYFREWLAGRHWITTEGLYRACERLLAARLDLDEKPAAQVAQREQFLQVTQKIEKVIKGSFDVGRLPISDLETARYHRLT